MRNIFKHYREMPSILRGTTNICATFTLFLFGPSLYIFSPYLNVSYRVNGKLATSAELREAMVSSHALTIFTLIGIGSLVSAISLLKRKKWTRFLVPMASAIVIVASLASLVKSEGRIFDFVAVAVIIGIFSWVTYTYRNNKAVSKFYA